VRNAPQRIFGRLDLLLRRAQLCRPLLVRGNAREIQLGVVEDGGGHRQLLRLVLGLEFLGDLG
jgi:hypothetical protein